MQCDGAHGIFPRRAPFGRKESPPWAGVPPDAVCPRWPERPSRTPPPPRSAASVPGAERSRMSPRLEKIARLGVLVLAEAWSRALFSQHSANGAVPRWLARGDRAVRVGAPSEG